MPELAPPTPPPTPPRPELDYHTAKRFGRPTTITPELIDAIASLVAEGHYVEVACAACGVPERTYYHWLERGKAHTQQGQNTLEAEFWQTVKGYAEPWGEIELIRDAKSGRLGWQGPMTVVSRRHRARWQDKESENYGPRLVVQIGVGNTDVKVGVALSPANISDLACGNPGQVEILSPINGDYVNHALSGDTPATVSDRQLPAVESPGGPLPGAQGLGGQSASVQGKGRRAWQRKKGARG